MPAPIKVDLPSLVYLVNVYRNSIQDMHSISVPLFAFLGWDSKWFWSKDCQSSLDEQNRALTHCNRHLSIIVAVNASDHLTGAVLRHKFPDSSERQHHTLPNTCRSWKTLCTNGATSVGLRACRQGSRMVNSHISHIGRGCNTGMSDQKNEKELPLYVLLDTFMLASFMCIDEWGFSCPREIPLIHVNSH